MKAVALTDGNVLIETNYCTECGKNSLITVPEKEFTKWRTGTPIQLAFPDMPAQEREMLITGIHPECWKRLFGNPFDDEEEE